MEIAVLRRTFIELHHYFSLLIPREFSADVLLDANSWWVTGGTGYGGVLATTGKTFRMNPRLRD